MEKATSLRQIGRFFRPEPLKIYELDDYYVQASTARGENPTREIELMFEDESDFTQKILFAGYTGCGKSTELNKLQKALQDDYLIVNYSVEKELDPFNLHYIELFIATMEQLYDVIEQNQLHESVSKEYLDYIQNWVQSEEVEKVKERHFGVEGEAGMEFGIPFLKSFFSKFRMAAKSNNLVKRTIKETIEPKLSVLIDQCNALIREVGNTLGKLGKKDLIIIIEDLDKLPHERAHPIFYGHSKQLTSLGTNILFTFPIPLLYHVQFGTIRPNFDQTFELPMVKIFHKDGSIHQEGRDIMRDIVERRMDIALFDSEQLLEEIITYSGGCIRDLIYMIKAASSNARVYEREKITAEDTLNAVRDLKREYDRTLADKVDPNNPQGKVLIRVETYYKVLEKLINDPNKRPDNTQEVMDLRQNLCILGYNGDGWCDVHPIVKEVLKDRGLLDLSV